MTNNFDKDSSTEGKSERAFKLHRSSLFVRTGPSFLFSSSVYGVHNKVYADKGDDDSGDSDDNSRVR